MESQAERHTSKNTIAGGYTAWRTPRGRVTRSPPLPCFRSRPPGEGRRPNRRHRARRACGQPDLGKGTVRQPRGRSHGAGREGTLVLTSGSGKPKRSVGPEGRTRRTGSKPAHTRVTRRHVFRSPCPCRGVLAAGDGEGPFCNRKVLPPKRTRFSGRRQARFRRVTPKATPCGLVRHGLTPE